jgi:NAD(P)-dependent dehydrogenase (short-subunit alcohol dehydrogenase family)
MIAQAEVLVNNAGNGMPGGISDVPDDILRMTTDVCYLAPAELCRQAIPRLLRRPRRQRVLDGRHRGLIPV